MGIKTEKEPFPVQLFYIQIAVYDGAVRCLIREDHGVLSGDHYITPRNERVELTRLMVPTGSNEDRELPRMMICDDARMIDQCVLALREGLREAAQQLVPKSDEIVQIVSGDEIMFKRQNFVGNVIYGAAKM
jgi:hypothetical protein